MKKKTREEKIMAIIKTCKEKKTNLTELMYNLAMINDKKLTKFYKTYIK